MLTEGRFNRPVYALIGRVGKYQTSTDSSDGLNAGSLVLSFVSFLTGAFFCPFHFGDLLATPSDVDQLHQRAFAFLKQECKTLPARLKRR